MVVPKLSDENRKGTAEVSGNDVGQISSLANASLKKEKGIIRKSAKPVALLNGNEFKVISLNILHLYS
jgi:hypothetical protein